MADEPQPQASGKAPTDRRPFQFGLKHLLAAPVVVALFLGLAHYVGFHWAAGLAVLAFVAIGLLRRWLTIGEALTCIAIAGILIALTLPAVQCTGRSSARNLCSARLKSIACALHNYHDVYGCFPPAYVADKNGRPMHSWRVLILPYLEHQELYEQYRFDEPWNGPHNSKLDITDVWDFWCPGDRSGPRTQTNYLLVVGPETVWPGTRCMRLNEIRDGTRNTILVVEVRQSGIHWMEPRDLDIAKMPLAINAKAGQGISSSHNGGAWVAFADGHLAFLPNTLPPAQLRGLLTTGSGKPGGPK